MFEKLEKDFDENPVKTVVVTAFKVIFILFIVGIVLRIASCALGIF